MIIDLNFNIEAWIRRLSITANSEKDAIDKLMGMTLADILKENPDIDSDIEISEITTDIAEFDATVLVSEIEYDLDPEIMDISVIEYLKNLLPKEQTISLVGVRADDNIEELVKDYIFDETNYDTISFTFKVLEKK